MQAPLLTKNRLFQLSTLTLFGFSAIGAIVIALFHDISFPEAIMKGRSIPIQLGVGLTFGLLSGLFCLFFVRLPIFKKVKDFFGGMLQKLNLNLQDIVFYSFCAGVGEEVFFRAAMQPLVGEWATNLYATIYHLTGYPLEVSPEMVASMGVWVTAVLFVALHGYLNPKNWRLTFFGFILIFVSAGLGLLYDHYGFFAAASAHFMYDLVMFSYVIYFEQK